MNIKKKLIPKYQISDHVHIMIDGRIVKSGGMELAAELEKNGYEAYKA